MRTWRTGVLSALIAVFLILSGTLVVHAGQNAWTTEGSKGWDKMELRFDGKGLKVDEYVPANSTVKLFPTNNGNVIKNKDGTTTWLEYTNTGSEGFTQEYMWAFQKINDLDVTDVKQETTWNPSGVLQAAAFVGDEMQPLASWLYSQCYSDQKLGVPDFNTDTGTLYFGVALNGWAASDFSVSPEHVGTLYSVIDGGIEAVISGSGPVPDQLWSFYFSYDPCEPDGSGGWTSLAPFSGEVTLFGYHEFSAFDVDDPLSSAPCGGDPPIFGDIMVFPTPERFLDADLNGDGDRFDTVLRYKNLQTGVIVNTGLECSGADHGLDIWEETIVFSSGPLWAVRCYDIETGAVRDTGGTGRHPAINGKWIVFEGLDGTIQLFDMEAEFLVETGIPGSYPGIYDGVVAFQSGSRSTIWHYDITTGIATDTGAVGRRSAIYEDLIVFSTQEGSVQVDLNGDGDQNDAVIRCYDLSTHTTIDTGATGDWPAIFGDVVVFRTLEVSVSTDLNGDGRTYASVIQYLHLPSGQVTNTGQLGTVPDIYNGTISFHALESWSGFDWSGDGDTRDSVVLTCPVQLDACPFATEPSADPGSTPELPSR
ncbi:hypothetical protein KAU37_03650 [Candidatus Bipolaricaulota bacterium]|nr:hypothetical protein [Candidatus Bipolaricaulota bacterium]